VTPAFAQTGPGRDASPTPDAGKQQDARSVCHIGANHDARSLCHIGVNHDARSMGRIGSNQDARSVWHIGSNLDARSMGHIGSNLDARSMRRIGAKSRMPIPCADPASCMLDRAAASTMAPERARPPNRRRSRRELWPESRFAPDEQTRRRRSVRAACLG
jgi:hypothetical protein